MFYKSQICVFVLSVFELVIGHPVHPETLPLVNKRVVVRVTARAAPTSTCSVCAPAVTVTVSGAATFTADPAAITVYVGFSATASATGIPIAGSTSPGANVPSSTTISSAVASPTSSIGNFGSCSTPEIKFGAGFDGQEATFQPVNITSYNHASAPDISTITQFICDALSSSCGADETAQTTCAQAQSAADAATPQEGIDADIFNGFFGIVTDFAATPAHDGTGNIITSSTTTSTSTSVTGTQAAASPSTSSIAATANSAKTTTAVLSTISITPTASTGTSGNLQTFTGNLGGVAAAPAVLASGSQFQVEGSSSEFKTKADALTRSCADQHNDCADAANASGNKGDLTVTACNTQQDACNSAANGA